MTASINKTVLIGNVEGDPELRKTKTGKSVTRFSVATHDAQTDDAGERRERTQWLAVKTWGALAERCHQYLYKGRQVYVEGTMYSRTYEDKEGQTREVWELSARNVQFLGSWSPKPQGTESESWPIGGEEDSCSELTLEKCGPHFDSE